MTLMSILLHLVAIAGVISNMSKDLDPLKRIHFEEKEITLS